MTKMYSHKLKKVVNLSLLSILTAFGTGNTLADDSEIYFGPSSKQPVNVLFLIDTSATMGASEVPKIYNYLNRIYTNIVQVNGPGSELWLNANVGVRTLGGKQIFPPHNAGTTEVLYPMREHIHWSSLTHRLYLDTQRPSGKSNLVENIWHFVDYHQLHSSMFARKMCGDKNIVIIGNAKGISDVSSIVFDDNMSSSSSAICRVMSRHFPMASRYCGSAYEIGIDINFKWQLASILLLKNFVEGLYAKYNIKFHTILFGNGIRNSAPDKAFKTIATAGKGKYTEYISMMPLSDWNLFATPSDKVLTLDVTSTPGTVFTDPKKPYQQRQEIYYNLVKTDHFDYWNGNTKRFRLTLVKDTGLSGQRPVIVDAKGNYAIGNEDGYSYFKKNTFSWWNETAKPDGGDVFLGGTLLQIPYKAENRTAPFTVNASKTIILDENADLSNEALAAKDEKERKELLQYIRGYETDGTRSLSPKLGDSIHSKVSLATYGACKSDKGASSVKCDIKSLDQVAFVTSNDGFFRGYDVNTGKTLFAYMPYGLLKNIKALKQPKKVNGEQIKTYGLDNAVVIHIDDKNKDGYINGTEKAYAYLTMGRGGKNIYAMDITNKDKPKLMWTILGGENSSFKELGYTWSTPSLGKVKVNDKDIDVLVFGGGYDPQQDQTETRKADSIGKGIYIVNAKTGALMWSGKDFNSELKYSMPGGVALLKNDQDYITDMFIGDMGGQLWRFHIDASSKESLKVLGQLVGSFADTDKGSARRFYQQPSVYKFVDKKNLGRISVNIGSGYVGHPLVTYNADRFYSLNLPLAYNSSRNPVLSENDLALLKEDGRTLENGNNVTKTGFYVKFTGRGEKLISGLMADFERVQFNTFIPSKYNNSNSNVTCNLGIGTQRTYTLNLKTGKSLTQGLYGSSSIGSIPTAPTIYCSGKHCSFVSGLNTFDKNYTPPKVVCEGADCPIGTSSSSSSNYVNLCLAQKANNDEDCFFKTSWTDLFDPLGA